MKYRLPSYAEKIVTPLGCVFFFLFFVLNISQQIAAQELVYNGSFEIQSSCPTGGAQVWRADGWHDYGNGEVLFVPTPDLLEACVPFWQFQVPLNLFGFQSPSDGDTYCGLWSHSSNYLYRELIGSMLLQPLIQGHTYFVSFKTCLADSPGYGLAINHMGIKFSTIPFDSINHPTPLSNISHVYSDSIITDQINWTVVSGDFVADSAYQYVIVGNFFDDLHTDTTKLSAWSAFSYYYVDEVSVIDATPNGISDFKNNSFPLFPNPATATITLQLPISKTTDIIVFNILGEEVMRQYISLPSSSIALNISSLARGAYFVVVRNEREVFTSKFIKQ